MLLPWRPSITYSGGTLTLALSQRPFDEGVRSVGAGYDESAAGVPSVWVTRWDNILTLHARLWESERAALLTYLRTVAGSGEAHTLRLDQGDPATEFTVYLVSPKAGDDEVTPARSGDTHGMLEMELKYRRTTGAAFGLNYSGV